jgi:hypothetical protein
MRGCGGVKFQLDTTSCGPGEFLGPPERDASVRRGLLWQILCALVDMPPPKDGFANLRDDPTSHAERVACNSRFARPLTSA